MSTPISQCTINKAALGDQESFKWLVEAMEYNMTQVAYTIFPCECKPPCPKPTNEQIDDLNRRVGAAIKERQKKWQEEHPPRPVGDFSKWVFPIIKSIRFRSPWYKRMWYKLTNKPDPYDIRTIMNAQSMRKDE